MKTSAFLFPLLVSCAAGKAQLTPEKLVSDIQESHLRDILTTFDTIASQNGGTRAFGLPGFNASLKYVLEYMSKNSSSCSKYDTTIQPFTHLFSQTKHISLIGPQEEAVDVISLQYNHPTPLPDGLNAPLASIPIDDERGTGCFEDQWSGVDVSGKIALVKRGKCHFVQVLKLAKAHGASAAIIFNNVPNVKGGSASLGAENYGTLVPLGVITYEQGMAWYERLHTEEVFNVHLTIETLTEIRDTWQILLETKEGDPDNVILLGAHLDSVQEGAGINDNASGVAALLTIAKSLEKYQPRNKVRFAFWGAEESGMIGSSHYVSTLTAAELDKIRFYFNYDMIASPSPASIVYATSEGDKKGAQFLYDFLKENSRSPEFATFGSSSDYVAFLDAGIPSSGIFTGAGKPYDECYHTSCDDVSNINWDALVINAKAAAYGTAQLALLDPENLLKREETNLNPRSLYGASRNLVRWVDPARDAEKRHDCGGSAY
uniref:Peptide hydrolase n=1 Tax=Bionectria ochroleuca TaxID=29856 RepID=A0A8H7MZ17_BIOOC